MCVKFLNIHFLDKAHRYDALSRVWKYNWRCFFYQLNLC